MPRRPIHPGLVPVHAAIGFKDHYVDLPNASSPADRLAFITIAVVVASVVAHGISVRPLMNRCEKKRKQQAAT